MAKTPPIVLTIAASDPTGGAGLQADCLAIAALGAHPVSIVTALTAQDTRGVAALAPVEPAWIEQQARVLLADVRVDAIKLGALGSAANAMAVAGVLAAHAGVPVVCDPVLASGRGDPLGDEALPEALRERILPAASLVTPNAIEARRLARAGDDAAPDACARALLALGVGAVLVTGTHLPGEQVVNTLHGRGGVLREDRWSRLPGEYHGSGCTLALAIATLLAQGRALTDAVGEAQAWTWRCLAAGFAAGAGQSIPDRFFATRRSAP